MADSSGLLIVDKPIGPSSHTVVGRVRRTLGTRLVGHAGTLDPMASGVLVVMVGACTKLSRFFSLEEKIYRATVRLGIATDTLDAEGSTVAIQPPSEAMLNALGKIERGESSPEDEPTIAQAVTVERARTIQVPPAHSAIKQGGVASYRRARKGQKVELPPRDVRVLALKVEAARVDPPELQVWLHVSKGYYVRSMARDMGESLGVPAHLTSLRRLRSGPWGLEGAVSMNADERTMRAAIVSVEAVARQRLPSAELTAAGARRALFGQKLSDDDFAVAPVDEQTAWFGPDGRLVAVGDRSCGRPTVLRAFLHADEMC